MHRWYFFPNQRFTVFDGSGHRLKHRLEHTKVDEGIAEIHKVIRDLDNHIEAGFQFATFRGPLCAEPVEGMAYFVEQVEIDTKSLEREIGKSQGNQICY